MVPKLAFTRILPLLLLASFVSFSSPARADGAATYKSKCAMCHGADGKGDTPAGKNMGAHDFTSADVKKESDADLIAITSKGKNKMPAYAAKLSEAEIKDVISYVRQLAK
jgi:mono/diheme cytochrome c family protein